MGRKRRVFQHSNTQRYPLRDHIDLHHPLVELADMIDWAAIDRVATEPFQPGPGRPILRPRLIAGLLYLQHAFNLSDEQVVAGWLENPYWQVFTGETHLQTAPPIDPSSLSRWRKRLGEVGMEELLAQSIEAAKRANVIKPSSVQRVIVDTTVMEKAIAYPTDSALLERSRQHPVRMMTTLKGREKLLTIWKRQKGRCPICCQAVTRETGWDIHHVIPRAKWGGDQLSNLEMLPLNCHWQHHNTTS